MSIVDDMMNSPIALQSAGSGIDAGGAIIGAISHLQFGQQAQAADQYQAAQLRQNAGQQQASAQRGAYDVDLQAKYIASAALASAAGSGAGASDPTVVNLIARNAGQMAYRSSVALYQGDDKARMMNMQADAKDFEGKNTSLNSDMVAGAGLFSAATTLMKGNAREASLYQRFSGGGPGVNTGYA